MIMMVDSIATDSMNSSRGHIIDHLLRYDIALLRLSTEATLNAHVQLGTLPPAGQVLSHDSPCYITGWGRTQSESVVMLNKTERSLML